MERSQVYSGTITAEQFLFYEIRIASKYYLDGVPVEAAIEEIKENNLFQYPTERLVSRMVRSCYKRLDALNNDALRWELSAAPIAIAKQINLYAMMRYNRLVWDFMVGVIGEKYKNQDFSFTRKDVNAFFSHLQEQNDDVAGWSELTISKIKQVLTKVLVEAQMLDTVKSDRLNPLFLCDELEDGIRANNDTEALAAFNCFRYGGSGMGNIKQELDRIRDRISDPSFLANKGLSNEVGIHVFCYDPADEIIVRDFIARLKGEKGTPYHIQECDLYEIFLKLLEDKRVLKSVDALEERRGKNYLLDQLQKIATPEALLEYMKYEPHKYGDVLFLTGVGKIYPFMRSHKMLDSMQHLFADIPIVMFYPGSFNGQDLGLFGKFLDGHYYRAFNLL